MLIAPDFDESVMRVAAYLNLDLELFKYTAVQEESTKQLGLVCESIEIERASEELTTIRSIDDILDYCNDESVKSALKKIIAYLESKGCELKPYKGGKNRWIECMLKDEEICYFQPKKKWFRFQCWDGLKEGWMRPKQIKTFKQWESECKPYVDRWLISMVGD